MIENYPDFKSKQNKMSESSRKTRISKMNCVVSLKPYEVQLQKENINLEKIRKEKNVNHVNNRVKEWILQL